MTLDQTYLNAASAFKSGNYTNAIFTKTGEDGEAEQSIGVGYSKDSEYPGEHSIVSTFNGTIEDGTGSSYDLLESPYTAIDNIEDLMEFMGENGADWDSNVVSTNVLEDGSVQCFNENGEVILEYKTGYNDEGLTEAYRINYDTNGDGVVNENDNNEPTYNKVGKNENGEVLVYETKEVDDPDFGIQKTAYQVKE